MFSIDVAQNYGKHTTNIQILKSEVVNGPKSVQHKYRIHSQGVTVCFLKTKMSSLQRFPLFKVDNIFFGWVQITNVQKVDQSG